MASVPTKLRAVVPHVCSRVKSTIVGGQPKIVPQVEVSSLDKIFQISIFFFVCIIYIVYWCLTLFLRHGTIKNMMLSYACIVNFTFI